MNHTEELQKFIDDNIVVTPYDIQEKFDWARSDSQDEDRYFTFQGKTRYTGFTSEFMSVFSSGGLDIIMLIKLIEQSDPRIPVFSKVMFINRDFLMESFDESSFEGIEATIPDFNDNHTSPLAVGHETIIINDCGNNSKELLEDLTKVKQEELNQKPLKLSPQFQMIILYRSKEHRKLLSNHVA